MSETNMRMTKQRRLILEELRKTTDHPTAYDVYERVKGRIPKISLGTVYRNLESLCASGIIARLDVGQGQRRFDAQTQEHSHIRCVSCGRVDDIPLNTVYDAANIMDIVSRASGYDVLGCGMDFCGLCPECKKKGKSVQSEDPTR